MKPDDTCVNCIGNMLSYWKSPYFPMKQMSYVDRPKGKVILELFFGKKGVVHHKFIPDGYTMNKSM
jgi:hypothetical protein